MKKCLQIVNDYGVVDLTPELLAAYQLLADAAYELQMTVGELASDLQYAPTECPHCLEVEKDSSHV